MSTRLNEIKLDLEDLNSLLENATRQKSKDLLSLEIRKLQSELINLQCTSSNEQSKASTPATSAPKCFDVKLNNYAWDQSKEFVKLYVTVHNVQSLPKEAVYCNFFDRSIDLHVNGLDNKNYILTINNLYDVIDTTKSYIKIKTDMIVVFLAKTKISSWSFVTSVEKVLKEAKTTKFETPSPNADPQASLMNLMKKMYQDGDDDLKRIIAKAWTEGRENKDTGLGDLPGF